METKTQRYERLWKEGRDAIEREESSGVASFSQMGKEICVCGDASEGIEKIVGEWFCKTCHKSAWFDEGRPIDYERAELRIAGQVFSQTPSFPVHLRSKSILGRGMCHLIGALHAKTA